MIFQQRKNYSLKGLYKVGLLSYLHLRILLSGVLIFLELSIITYKQSMFQTVLLVILLLLPINSSWNSYSDIRTGRVELFNSNAYSLNTSSVPVSFMVTFTAALSQTTSCGTGIVGFQTTLSNQFSINVTLTNFITTSVRVAGMVFDDTLVSYLSVNYIAVGAKTYFLEVQFSCFLPTVLSTGNGTRTETRTTTTLFTNQALTCNLYFSGFRVDNSQGLINYLSGSVTCNNGTAISHTFTTSQSNKINQICYTTLIFCDACTKASTNYYEWGQLGSVALANSVLPSSKNIGGSTRSRYEDYDRMFWGMNVFNVSRAFSRGFNLQTDYTTTTSPLNIDANYASYSNSGTYLVNMDYFFIATRNCDNSSISWFIVTTQTCESNCTSPLTYTLNSTARYCNTCDQTCLTCDGSLSTNCTSCLNTTYRVLVSNTCSCQSGYIDVGVVNCYPCEYYIPGCSVCLTSAICSNCSSGFTLNMLGICQCTSGFLVTGVCTTLVGCISATNLLGSVYCLACNSTLHYVRSSNFTCVCDSGYVMNAVEDCVSICGDSVIVSGQGCDDGNKVSGDGCSSTCQVETNYYCDNSFPPSNCYIIANITATVKYVQRVLTANQATFAIDLQPYYSDYLFMDFGGFISTNLPCDKKQLSYLNNLLLFNCWYPYTIEGLTYTLNLTLDTKFFTNGSKISVTLPASGMNAKLTYDANYALNTPLSMMVIVLDVIAIIVFFVSAITERMIGVEMLQTLQSVLYSMALMKTCPSTLAALQSLRYSNGYNQPQGVDPVRRFPYAFAVGEVGLDQQFILNYNISYVILITVIFLMIVLKLIMFKFEQDKAIEQREFNRKFEMEEVHKNYFKIRRVYKFIFQRVFFLLCFMNMFLVIFGVAVQMSNLVPGYLMTQPEFNLLLCGIASCLLVTFLAMVIMNGLFPSIRLFPMFMHHKYPVYYVIYNSAFIILISYLYTQKWLLYVLLAMAVLNLLILLCYLPYIEKIHNLTLAFNQVTIILALGAYLYEQSSAKTDTNQGIFTIIIIVLLAMLYICVILSVYRLYRFYQYMKLRKLSYEESPQQSIRSEEKEKLSFKEQQMDIEIIENKVEGSKSSKAIKPLQQEYYENLKVSNHPLNSARDQDNVQTKKGKSSNTSRLIKDNEDYDTFSRNASKNNTFRIDPIDPHPLDVSINRSPYNQYGEGKSNQDKEEEIDALKLIKSRLRKDFYHKVRQTQYKQPQKLELLDKSKDKLVNFLPSDYNDQP